MTHLRSSNTPPFPSPERPAACSLPIALTRPSRHSSLYGLGAAHRRATFTGDFRLRGDTRPPPPAPWRSTSPPEPTKQGWAETGSTKPVRPETARTTGCVAFPEPAHLIHPPRFVQSERSSRGSEDEQERTRLPRRRRDVRDQSHRRAHGGAVFSAIGDALARDEPVAIAGFGQFVIRDRAARQVAIRKPGSPSPSRPRRCRRSRRRRPFETRSTDSVAGQAAPPFVPATPPPVHPFAIRTRRSARPGSRKLPLRLRQADRRTRASRIARSPDALHAERDRTGDQAHSPGRGTFVAGRRRGDFCVLSHAQTPAQHLSNHVRRQDETTGIPGFVTHAHTCAVTPGA